jgi:acetyl esterase/lipase
MRLILNLFSLLSALAGILIHTPDDDNDARQVKVALNELSWVAVLLGLFAALFGLLLRPRAWVAALAGLLGAGLAAVPFTTYRAAAEDMQSSMRAALGKTYEDRIPPQMFPRLAQHTWSVPNALGARERAARARVWRNVTFATPAGQALKLDIYQPFVQPAAGERYPAIIVIHWGGWRGGDKGGYIEPNNRYRASQGYVVFDIQYRFSDRFPWPAQLEDVQAALAWVRQHADEYRVDPARLALMGRSAGGHLALMAGMCDAAELPLRAIIAIYAPTKLDWDNLAPNSAITQLIGAPYAQKPDAYVNASPIHHVRDGLPPIMLVEAMMDSITPNWHGDELSNRLALTDTPIVRLRVPWARHGFDAVTFGLGAQLTQYHIDRFLAWSLYGEPRNA